MATEVGHAYYPWSHQEMPDNDASQEASISQMFDHGSILFGRYAVENLSWEKKSVFNCNRRQEELENFRRRGLVAQKKAFFEEYFKRTRAAKSMQDKQKSEIRVDYKDSVGQNEPMADFKHEGNQVANFDNICQGHGSTGVCFEEASHPSEILQASSLSLSPKDSDKNQKENSSRTAAQMQQLDPKVAMDGAQAMSGQTIENHEINNINNQKENYYEYAVQMQHLQPKIAADEAPAISEQNINNHGKISFNGKQVSERDVNPSHNRRPTIAAKLAAPDARNSKQQRPKISHDENGTREEKSQNKQTYKEARNHSRNKLNLDCKRKPELKSSNRLNSDQVKAETNICISTTTTAKVLKSHNSFSIYSSKSVLEGQPKVTIPQPFSFATEKRAATPSSLRDYNETSTLKLPDRMTSSPIHERNRSHVRSTSDRATVANDGKGRKEKRNCEKGRLLVPDTRHTSFTRKGGTGVEISKSRTINIPQGSKSINPCSGGENKAGRVVREIREMENHPSLNPSKMRYSNLSLDSKKPRQEKPRWR